MIEEQSVEPSNNSLTRDNWITTTFNLIIAIAMALLTLPIFVIIAVLIKLQSTGPIFYASPRMGLHKSTFTMYKFRTLILGAEAKIGSNLVSRSNLHLEIPMGKFLRDTRIDELPQLLNVLKGDMNIIGPRPERRAVYDAHCAKIPWYDKRFEVKPGIIGYSQLFTPHSASKRTRATIDNFYMQRKHRWISDFILLFYGLCILSVKLIEKIGYELLQVSRFLLFKHRFTIEDKRQSNRINCHECMINIWYQQHTTNQAIDSKGALISLNDQDIYAVFDSPLTEPLIRVQLTTSYKTLFQFKPRHKSVQGNAQVKISLLKQHAQDGKYHYIITLLPLSPLNLLKLHKYFLNKSIS
jgi:lipopolysaccharide/colanic/teichoic acid biosynthesis glycosyltransferase